MGGGKCGGGGRGEETRGRLTKRTKGNDANRAMDEKRKSVKRRKRWRGGVGRDTSRR